MGQRPYKPETCGYCSADTWCEIRANGKPQCRACKVERFFTEVLYPPLRLQLLPWQKKILREVYGTVKPEDGLRQYRHAYGSVAKKNGKSFLVGGLPIYHLCMEDEEITPEVYGCAAAKDQASIVYRSSAKLVRANPDLLSKLRLLESTKRIIKRDGNGFYVVLSADGDVQDGIEPSLLLRDEIHRWKGARAKTLYDVTTKGQISRREPLDIAITTAGAEYESPLWWNEYSHCKDVLTGAVINRAQYVAIWEADSSRFEKEPDYWKSREARVAANPSHEDLGGFLTDTAIVYELDKAISQPAEKSAYLRYHLNLPLKTEEDPIIEMDKWHACGGGIDLRDWPTYDYELLMRKWALFDKPCWAGVDASWTTDLTCLMCLFPPWDAGLYGQGCEEWTLMPFFWMPKNRVEKLSKVCQVPFDLWIEQGFVHATPGEQIDQRAVMERIRWVQKNVDLREVPYDRANFRSEANTLFEEGVPTIEVPQNFMQLSQPTKFLLGAILSKTIRHGNNPVLNWMAACLQLQYDQKDNCQPSKPKRLISKKRIDGMQAAVTALNRAMVAPGVSSGVIEVW